MLHLAFPLVPWLTWAVLLGMVVAQFPLAWTRLDSLFAAGLRLSSRRLLRIGIVVLGLQVSLTDVAGLGAATIGAVIVVVTMVFACTWLLGRLFRLPGSQPLLIASGFSICGVSAIGAVSAVARSTRRDVATSVALVTLCGSLAIAVLPALQGMLDLDTEQFGLWVGLSVHDVGQVVATAQIAGTSALAIAVVVKVTRVLTLAPLVALIGVFERRRIRAAESAEHERFSAGGDEDRGRDLHDGKGDPRRAPLPPIVPVFVVGFVAAMIVRTVVPLPTEIVEAASWVQSALFALALFALGTSIRWMELVRTGWRALVVGLLAWALIAGLSLLAVWVLT